MTLKRSWLALGALLTALVVGAAWAAEQEKKSEKVQAPNCCAIKLDCCEKEKGTACGEGKCCNAEKGCCGGKCDCCKQAEALPPPAQAYAIPSLPPAVCCPRLPDGSPGVLTIVPTPQYQPPPPPLPAPPFVPFTQYVQAVPSAPPSCMAWATATSAWRMTVVEEGGKACLGMQSAVGTSPCATCENMVLKVGGDALKVAVVGKQVQVHGKCVRATADSMCWCAHQGEIVLEGSVKLKYDGDGQKADVTAEHVVVGIRDGSIEVRGATPTVVRGRKPVEPPNDVQQTFEFWTGFFR
jgi:hypothetical protein